MSLEILEVHRMVSMCEIQNNRKDPRALQEHVERVMVSQMAAEVERLIRSHLVISTWDDPNTFEKRFTGRVAIDVCRPEGARGLRRVELPSVGQGEGYLPKYGAAPTPPPPSTAPEPEFDPADLFGAEPGGLW